MTYEERQKDIVSFLDRKMLFHARMELDRLIEETGNDKICY